MEILGLLDSLESMILDGLKVPLTKKILVDEEKVLSVIDKMRLVAQGGGGFAKEAINSKFVGKSEEPSSSVEIEESKIKESESERPREEGKAMEVLQQAYQLAKEVRDGADKYADEVLANLEATSSRILRTIKAGRERIAKTLQAGEEGSGK